MGSVVLQNVTKQFGPKVVLEDVTLEIRSGETVGLIGANGSGKTTIFKLITGLIEPEIGTVTRSRGLRVGYLPQEPDLDSDRTLQAEVTSALREVLDVERRLVELSEAIATRHDDPRLPNLLAEYDRQEARFRAADGHGIHVRTEEVLAGLGFRGPDRDLRVSALSGGQKCRAALAKLLLQDRDLLLLDEPTNHLDLEATRWLERFLAGHRGGAVIVSHDRYLLDRLVSRIIEVEDRRVTIYPGAYSNYVQVRELRRLTLQRQVEQDRAEIDQELDFIRRHRSAQRARQARGRRTRLERRLRSGELVTRGPSVRRRVSLKFGETEGGGQSVWRCEGLTKRYGDKVLFEDLTFFVARGERWGITGPNGTGKTTLLRIATGQVQADAGTARLGENLRVGYYDQEHAGLDRSVSVIDELRSVRPDVSEAELRSFLGRFLFSGDEVFKPIEKLSGGEQSRVRLARLILSSPQVLILDEPTNHLDIPSREALESALGEYEGTLIAVSHDRFFLDRTVSQLLVLERGSHRLFAGNYSVYVQVVEAEQKTACLSESPSPRATARRRRPRRTPPPTERSLYDGLPLEELEELLIAKEHELEAMTVQFASKDSYRDAEAARALQDRFHALRAEIAALDAAWQSRAEEIG